MIDFFSKLSQCLTSGADAGRRDMTLGFSQFGRYRHCANRLLVDKLVIVTQLVICLFSNLTRIFSFILIDGERHILYLRRYMQTFLPFPVNMNKKL